MEEHGTWQESLAAFEEEYVEDEVVNEEEPVVEEEIDNTPVDEEPVDENIIEFPEEKQNKAFQDMRRKLQEAENRAKEQSQYAEVIQRIADQNGTSPEKIIEEFNRREMEQEAKNNNLPVEYLQKQRDLESQLQQLKNESFKEKVNAQVTVLKEKYGLDQGKISEIAKFMDEKGFPLDFSWEDAYFLMDRDNIIEKQVKEMNQKRLEEKQSKRDGIAVPQGQATKSQLNDSSSVLTDDEYDAIKKGLEEKGVI